MSTPVIPWELWAPPLEPPTAGGLPVAVAQDIADATWATDAHLCAALQWEAYAAMLPPTAPVSQVATGAQSVSYSPAGPTGAYGLALQQAAFHRSFVTGQVVGVPMQIEQLPIWPARSIAQWEQAFPEGGTWTVTVPAEDAP